MTVVASTRDMTVDPTDSGWTIAGEVDASNVDRLAEAFARRPLDDGDGVVLDVAGVTFLDSSGLRVLLDLRRRLGDEGEVTLRGASRSVQRLLELTGLTPTFGLADPVGELRD
jgi:anti-sigma B factor antagonist